MKTKIAFATAILATFVAASTLALVGTAEPADAVTGAGFNPGYIISDSIFFNSNAMSQAQIQAFLVGQETGCTNNNCLYLTSAATPTLPESVGNLCGPYQGAADENASAMIYKVAQACGINPQVLLVTLQKEQGLVTSRAPSAGQYNAAMGYGCPDSTGCAATYYGLFNQLYDAAWQFRDYGANPTHFNFSVGSHAIRYSPLTVCGAPVVDIQNQATADLYNYTPYQPDASALTNLTGTGDSCASYGNRNFWVYFSNWFGNPGGNTNPVGVIDSVVSATNSVDISGWAFDPDTTSSISIQVTVNGGAPMTYLANGSRPDVNAAYEGIGDLHGYNDVVPVATSGAQNVCVTAVNQGPGSNTLIGCSTVNVVTAYSPQGVIDSVRPATGAVDVTGWAFDRDTTDPINVSITVNGGTPTLALANISRPDVAAVYGNIGLLHGYNATVPVTVSGAQKICVTAVNVGGGSDALLGCQTVTVLTGASPEGVIDNAVASPANIDVSGWAFDRDTTAPIDIEISVDGAAPEMALANLSRPDVNAVYGGVGLLHGFNVNVPVSGTGVQRVCVTAMNVAGGSNSQLGCRNVTMPGGSPTAVIDSAVAAAGQIVVSGWAFDPDTTASITMQVTIDGVSGTVLASGSRPDVAAAYPGYGANHGYTYSSPATPGQHSVCVVAENVGSGSNAVLGCRTLNEPSGSPIGALDGIIIAPGTMTAHGWAFDPDTSASITVQFTVDGGASTPPTVANQSRTDVAAIYPGYGPLHGFSSVITATPGAHTICAYALNSTGPGSTSLLGCKVVTAMSGSPVGVVDSVTKVGAGAKVSGWVWDPDTVAPISVRVEIDGSTVDTITADQARPDVGTVYPLEGPLHGYSSTVPVSSGQHQVCAYGVNTGPGSDTLLGCSTQEF